MPEHPADAKGAGRLVPLPPRIRATVACGRADREGAHGGGSTCQRCACKNARDHPQDRKQNTIKTLKHSCVSQTQIARSTRSANPKRNKTQANTSKTHRYTSKTQQNSVKTQQNSIKTQSNTDRSQEEVSKGRRSETQSKLKLNLVNIIFWTL